jgi:hypothetical protein
MVKRYCFNINFKKIEEKSWVKKCIDQFCTQKGS